MKKQTFKQHSKHETVAPKDLLREINERIIYTFTHLEKGAQTERSIDKELNWLYQDLQKNEKILNTVHVTTLLHHLGNLEISKQSIAVDIDLIKFSLSKCADLLRNTQAARMFSLREMAQLFNALPKLPVHWSNNKSLLALLLKRVTDLVSLETVSFMDSANILGGIAKLGIDFLTHQLLIKNLLKIFIAIESNLVKLDLAILSEVWQFCIYAKVKVPSATLDKLFNSIDKELIKKNKEIITPSAFQRHVYKSLLPLLQEKYSEQVREEYPVGAYSLDIAFPQVKLNIEIDGPFHYRAEKLKRIHQFRDFILKAYDNWLTIRIPYFEWEPLADDNQAKLDYLVKKLAEQDYLFNPTALERLKSINAIKESSKTEVKMLDVFERSIPIEKASDALNIYSVFEPTTLNQPFSKEAKLSLTMEDNAEIKATVNKMSNLKFKKA